MIVSFVCVDLCRGNKLNVIAIAIAWRRREKGKRVVCKCAATAVALRILFEEKRCSNVVYFIAGN